MTIDPSFDSHMAELILRARLFWWIAAVSSLALGLAVLAWRCRRPVSAGAAPRFESLARTLRALHRCESAIASMEFLMVFLPFLIIVMTVWQLAFMFNAQIFVGYSAYAAARSASVMIPADLKNEKEGMLKKAGSANTEKWQHIRRAAIPGVLPISPGSPEDALAALLVAGATNDRDLGEIDTDPAAKAGLLLMGAHYGSTEPFQGTRIRRGLVKQLYAEKGTEVLINGKNHRQTQKLTGQTIAVTVNYPFYLNVPYVGRLIKAAIDGSLNQWNPYPSLELSETVHMKIWSRKRAIEPCNG